MAVDITTKQMALTRDVGPGGFMERVTATLAFTAQAVLSESVATAHHPGRALYAQRVMQNPQLAGVSGAPLIVMGINVSTKTTYNEQTQVATCTATDLELQSQIMTFWNALAGLDTPTS